MEKRKSQRSFDLQKSSHRSFDLDKKPTRSFELKKEQAASEVGSSPSSSGIGDSSNGYSSKRNNKALRNGIIFVLVLVVALCCWLFIPHGGNDQPSSVDSVPVVNQEQPEIVSQEVSEDTVDSDVLLADDQVNVSEPLVLPSEPQQTNSQSTSNANASVSNDVEAEALKVIDGVYGNNPDRRKLLGDRYEAIQSRVNEMKRQGLF